MKEIAEYIERAFENVPDSKEKQEMMQEITQSLEDSAGVHMSNGKQREDAVNKAIVDFGDLGEILLELKGQSPSSPPNAKQAIKRKRNLWFSICASLMFVALMVFINMYYSPKVVWFVYPVFAILWWPMSVFFYGRR